MEYTLGDKEAFQNCGILKMSLHYPSKNSFFSEIWYPKLYNELIGMMSTN